MEPPAAVAPGLYETPVRNPRVLSGFGRRRGRVHTGLDLRSRDRTDGFVRAAREGVVESAGRDGPYGLSVLMRHADGWKTRYAHLRRIHVQAGQLLQVGDLIGLVGATGRATGPHLHFEILRPDLRPVDPAPWIGQPQ